MSSSQTPVHRRRGLKVALVILVLLLSVLVFTPRIIAYGLVSLLQGQGLDEVTVEEVDFNPFSGRLAIEMLQARVGADIVLTLEQLVVRLAWAPLGRRQIELRDVRVDGLLLDIEQKHNGELRVAGMAIPAPAQDEVEAAAAPTPWGFAIDRLRVRDSHLFVKLPSRRYRADIEHAQLQRLISWEPERSSSVTLDAVINAGRVHLDMTLTPLAQPLNLRGRLVLDGVELNDYAHLAGDAVENLSGTLSLDNTLAIKFAAADGLHLEQRGKVQLRDLRLEQQAVNLRHETLTWDGRLQLVSALQGGVPEITMQGRLAHAGLQLNLKQPALAAAYDIFSWDGQVHLADNLDESLKLHGGIELQGLRVEQAALQLLRVPQASITALASEGLNMIRADNIVLTAPELLAAPDEAVASTPVFAAATIGLDELALDAMSRLSIANVQIRDGLFRVTRNEDGTLAVVTELARPTGDQGQKAEAPQRQPVTQEAATPMAIRIGEIVMEGDSHLRFTDRAVQPPFNLALAVDRLRISGLNSAQPAQAARYQLSGTSGKYARVELQGELRPFLEQPAVTVSGTVKGYELPALSSYAAGTLGYDLRSGQLDADVSVTIDAGTIVAENQLTLNNLTVQVSDPDRVKGLTTQLSMPLDAALAMLRDKDNNIHLKLPVTGDLSNPQFDLGDIINTALGNVMKKSAMTYLTQALQPYGTLITLGKLVGKLANAVALDPVNFDANSSRLPADTEAYMQKLAGLLVERPQLRVRLCGMATEADRQALTALAQKQAGVDKTGAKGEQSPAPGPEIADALLLQLAQQRSEAVKDFLVSRMGIAAERLFVCQPDIDRDAQGVPRVELVI